jgi:hypothetical protein
VEALILEKPTVTDVLVPKYDSKGNPVEENVLLPATPASHAREINVNQKPPGKSGQFRFVNSISEGKEETDSPPVIPPVQTPHSAVSKASTTHTGDTTETELSPGNHK